ncbi:MAG TPA: hypothetical protein VFE53_26395 [Mucilaginibacter sp.]|jgi:hypothetical protein|nr:hypothetical protein [Mucilaginibacter sp.]
MKLFFTLILLLSFTINALGQQALKDSADKKDEAAVAELGAAASLSLNGGKASYGFNAAVEVTPIENWLELELGVSPTFGTHLKELDADLLFKKPWTLSQKVEFMFGLGVAWNHTSDYGVITNTAGGEVALDFMFWPSAAHRFGWYLEPAYEYDFGRGHEQSVGMSGGLLIAIP